MARDAVTLTDGSLEATFVPEAGMICRSLTEAGEQLLELQEGIEAYEQRGSIFGIPLLYPWANRLSDWRYDAGGERVTLDRKSPLLHRDGATGLPMHGVNGASLKWTVTDDDPVRVTAGFDFGAEPALMALFPFAHRLEYTAALDAGRLSIRLTVIPTADGPVPISFGFHPYVRLPGSDRREWRIALPVRRRALLDERQIPTGEHQPIGPGKLDGPLGERTFDDCFDELGSLPAAFEVADGRRRIAVEFIEGYDVAQVYAPEASQFMCFEPMTAPGNALISRGGLRWAEPGEPFTAEFAVAVSNATG
jgi:galactose mutarotase-like enzyme